MNLLHRMHLGHKFLALGLIALLLVLVPSALYFARLLEDVHVARLQVQGGGPLVALNRVVQMTQTHRGLSASMLSGNEALSLIHIWPPETRPRPWPGPGSGCRARPADVRPGPHCR